MSATASPLSPTPLKAGCAANKKVGAPPPLHQKTWQRSHKGRLHTQNSCRLYAVLCSHAQLYMVLYLLTVAVLDDDIQHVVIVNISSRHLTLGYSDIMFMYTRCGFPR
jgi:hypothetical protein